MLLNCHTYFSFRYGTFRPEALIHAVEAAGYSHFALTDINNTSAVLDTLRLCQGKTVKPVIGIDFRNGVQQQYVGLARNNEGFYELNRHLSRHLHTEEPFNRQAPAFDHAYVVYPFSAYRGWQLGPNEFIGVSPADLRQLVLSPYRNLQAKLVALSQVTFASKIDFNIHRLLRAIDENELLSRLGTQRQALGNEFLRSESELRAAYDAYPHIATNTYAILNDCRVEFEFGKLKSKNRQYYTGNAADDAELIRQECMAGLKYRYPAGEEYERALARMEKELDVIFGKQFTSYFLINWDIVKYAASKGYYHVGRGSGANSLVAYLLRITDVDPIQLDLYFERFINMHRANAPDFDIDFSWTDRDDITSYIFKRFNTGNNVALLGSYNTFQKDAVILQLGKVYGLPPGEIGQLKRAKHPEALDPVAQQIMRYAARMNDFPGHLSIHASGILISEKDIHCYSATSLPPKNYPTTQFSMLEAEDIGLFKFDILSQRGLGKIKDALAIIRENRGDEIDIHDVKRFYEDGEVKKLLREGKAIGCFYVESPGMRMLLAKLRADDYLRLVAASSIIRPGVAQSGMMQEYIRRFREPAIREEARSRLPLLYDLLEETYGVMVYQEDVIRVAHEFAGLTLAESDALRRGMSWKYKTRGEFMAVRDTFMRNCEARGYDRGTVNSIWHQIETFANFAFSKGHSASYAVESYQALYLKAHYPREYMVATLNNGGGFYRKELYVHEARMHGAEVKLPCINNSAEESVIRGKTIYLGLDLVNGLTAHTRSAILQERRDHGAFLSLEDFTARVPLSIEQVRLLIRSGTFAFTGKGKKELLWQVHTLVQPAETNKSVPSLFRTAPKTFKLPRLEDSVAENAFDEMELIGFTLHDPFSLLGEPLSSTLLAADLRDHISRHVVIYGYLVNTKATQTVKGRQMYFGTFIDREGAWIDTVHFPEIAAKYPFTGPGCYRIEGRVDIEYDFISIEVSRLQRIPYIDRETLTGSIS